MNWLELWNRHRDRFDVLVGVLCIGAILLIGLALATHDSNDAIWFASQPEGEGISNVVGRVGATVAELLLQLFGAVAWLVPVGLGLFAWNRLRRRPWPDLAAALGVVVLVAALGTLLALLYDGIAYGGKSYEPGGLIGRLLGDASRALLNRTGAMILVATALAAVVVLSARDAFLRTIEIGAVLARRSFAGVSASWDERRREAERRRETLEQQLEPEPQPEPPVIAPDPTTTPADQRPSIALAPDPDEEEPAPLVRKPLAEPPRRREVPTQAALPIDAGERGYALPPLELLNESQPQSIESDDELMSRARLITEKLQEFNVGGTVVAVHPGPVVTTFEFKPDAGVKYSKITGMTDDLSLALKAESVRIARMPQKSTVGIEVPNRQKETIFPREVIGSEVFRASKSKLPMALGKDITGEAFVAELDKMPHLLIAGATGAGKSVGLNGMIISLLYRSTPRDLRFIMIDTKMIELGIYSDIPHLLIPVVTEAKKASVSLKWAVKEMEARYRKLAGVGVRNLAQFNELVERDPERSVPDPRSGEEKPIEHMPYIVVVIDEMADLMMVSGGDVEESIMRLAQMARAVGIHLILATQRPSVDVITGTIKANFPSRIAFRVSQRVDSRTIIDQQGAEHLLGRGDMLFLATGASRLQRLHGGYITETEINRITTFLKKMAEPIYDHSVLKEGETSEGGVDLEEFDDRYFDAVRCVIQEGKCSTTLIQRRLQLGYARAARIVDMMEQQGVVGPGEGSKPREILVGSDYVEQLEQPL